MTKDRGTWELDFGSNEHLQKQAQSLNGRQVHVTGSAATHPGVEVKERRIIQVTTLKPVTP